MNFQQGAFQISPNSTPEQIAKKRAAIAAMMPKFGSARYVGEGLGQLFQGIGSGRQEKKLDEIEAAGTQSATDIMARLTGARSGPSGPLSVIGMRPDPNSPEGIGDAAMTALGKAPDFAALEAQYGLPTGYLQRTAQIESGGDANAQNPKSSAGGMFQFIDSTAAQYGLTDRFDPMQAADAAARLAADNKAALTEALGREPTAGELYLAHQQGAGGAAELLMNGGAPASGLVGNDAVSLNGGNGGMTGSDFANQWTAKFDGAAPGPTSAPQIPINELYAALQNPWLAPEQKALVTSLIAEQQQASDPMRQLELEKAQWEVDHLGDNSTNAPAGFQSLDLQAQAAGYAPGTPEYQDFMRNGGGSGTPAAFTALDLQAQAAGFIPGTPEYQDFMATRGAGLAAGATERAKAEAGMEIAAPADIVVADRTLGYIEEVRNHAGRGAGTGATSVFNFIPGTSGRDFQNRVDQLKSGAFLSAIDEMRGMGSLSNAEGQTATAAITRMDTATSEGEFNAALDDYERIVTLGRDRAQKRIPAPADAPAAPPTGAANANKKTINGYTIEEQP